MELWHTTEIISSLQRIGQDLKNEILIVEENFQALDTENGRLNAKAELVDLWHHWIEEFETSKMEHAFMSA